MSNATIWYSQLIKPTWAPPPWLFGPVWTILYIIILISFGTVLLRFFEGKLSKKIILPFILNLIFNFIFSPVQFVLQNNILAAIDIVLILGTLIWAMIAIYQKMKWVAYVNIPYLIWVSFATVLQFTVTFLNI